jgi:hypothetical protein
MPRIRASPAARREVSHENRTGNRDCKQLSGRFDAGFRKPIFNIGKAYSHRHDWVIMRGSILPNFNPWEFEIMMKSTVLAARLALIWSLPASASAAPSCEVIDKAISAQEDFVEMALSGDAEATAAAQKAVHGHVASIATALPANLSPKTEAALTKLDAAVAGQNMSEASLAAMENYALLVEAFEKRLPTSRSIALLDHAGFKLQALAAAVPVDWSAIAATLQDANRDIETASGMISDNALRDVMQTISKSLASAQAAKNNAWITSSAQMLLDSVDLLERSVKNKSKQACS